MSESSKIVYWRPGTYYIPTMLEQKQEIEQLTARIAQLEAERAEMLAMLERCNEALEYFSRPEGRDVKRLLCRIKGDEQ